MRKDLDCFTTFSSSSESRASSFCIASKVGDALRYGASLPFRSVRTRKEGEELLAFLILEGEPKNNFRGVEGDPVRILPALKGEAGRCWSLTGDRILL